MNAPRNRSCITFLIKSVPTKEMHCIQLRQPRSLILQNTNLLCFQIRAFDEIAPRKFQLENSIKNILNFTVIETKLPNPHEGTLTLKHFK